MGVRGCHRLDASNPLPAETYTTAASDSLVKDDRNTHDPLRLKWGVKDMYVDLGAEQLVTAEKAGRKIAVEIKSFVGALPRITTNETQSINPHARG